MFKRSIVQPDTAPLTVHRNLWSYMEGDDKSKYCTIGNFCSLNFTGTEWGWRHNYVWLISYYIYSWITYIFGLQVAVNVCREVSGDGRIWFFPVILSLTEDVQRKGICFETTYHVSSMQSDKIHTIWSSQMGLKCLLTVALQLCVSCRDSCRMIR